MIPTDHALRVLFVNGTGFGGSLMSTKDLAAQLAALGTDVAVLQQALDCERTLWLHKRLENLRARSTGSRVEVIIDRLCRGPGKVPRRITGGDQLIAWESAVPANALQATVASFRPHVVVVASVLRPQWRQMQRDLQVGHIPSVLYLREGSALGHLDTVLPDLLIANSAALQQGARECGCRAELIPSVIDLAGVHTKSTRERALVINTRAEYGGELAWKLAALCPQVPFAFQESWRAGGDESLNKRARAARLDNVEVRSFESDPSRVYRDARVLVVPYPAALAQARPRVIVEALANSIPIVASDLAGLRDVAGNAGVFLGGDSDGRQWSAALERFWLDDDYYRAMVIAARAEADANTALQERLVNRFQEVMTRLVCESGTAAPPALHRRSPRPR